MCLKTWAVAVIQFMTWFMSVWNRSRVRRCVYHVPILLRDFRVSSASPASPRGTPLSLGVSPGQEGHQSPGSGAFSNVCTHSHCSGCLLLLRGLLVMWPCILPENNLVIHCPVPRSHESLSLEAVKPSAYSRDFWGAGWDSGTPPHIEAEAAGAWVVCLSPQLEVVVIYRLIQLMSPSPHHWKNNWALEPDFLWITVTWKLPMHNRFNGCISRTSLH